MKTITTNPNFTSAEYLELPANCACNKQVADVLKKLDILDDTGNFTSKGMEAKKSWRTFPVNDEHPSVYWIPIGTRKFVRIVSSERTHADGTFVVTFEWELVPNELGTALGATNERRTAEATFFGGKTDMATINMVPSITVTNWPK